MRVTSIFALVAGALSLGVESIQLVERDQPAVVQFGIERRRVGDPVKRDRLRRRQSSQTIQQVLDNELTLYFANVTLGTPPQDLRLHIDTGSSDLWTNSAKSRLCKSRANLCASSGTYNANISSTYQYVSSDFNISYVDGSGALGDYVTDTLRIGGAELKNLQFGIGYVSSSTGRPSIKDALTTGSTSDHYTEGILGIGYQSNEVQVNRNGKQPYSNLPQLMVDEGLIQSNAFSLWLDDLEASTGLVLFGGVNTEKYHGSLSSLPIARFPGEPSPSEFIIAMTGLSVTSNGNTQTLSSGTTIPVLLDSGSSLSYLPDNIVNDLFTMFSAEIDVQSQAAYVSCSFVNTDVTFNFTFTQPVITVPISELIIDPGVQPDGSQPTLSDGSRACLFGISSSGSSTSVLGDTFLRSAYVVYDLANDQISLAQTNFNSTQNSIKEITKGTDSVPNATGVPGAGTPVATQTGGGRIGSPTTTGTIKSDGSLKSHAPSQVLLAMIVFAISTFGLSVM